MDNIIAFPGLNLGPWSINPTAIDLGFIRVQWYGIIIVLGMVLACSYAFYRMKSLGLVFDNMLDIAIVCIPSGIVGARLYYVLTSLDQYTNIAEMFAVWNGGLAIYGGIIGGLLGVFAVCRFKKYKFLGVLDCIAPGVMIGQLIGRWGNFVNAEAYGVIGNYEFLGLRFDAVDFGMNNPLMMSVNNFNSKILSQVSPEVIEKFDVYNTGMLPVHPTFLYESLWNIIGFLLINAFWKHKKYDGQIVIMYASWYGLGRCIIEGFRGDSLYLGAFRISQLLAFLCFVAGVTLLVVFEIRRRMKKN